MKAVVVCSGGMDSATVLHLVAALYGGAQVLVLSFDYGQRHVRELQSAATQARTVGALHLQLPISIASGAGSALTDPAVPVPRGHYEAETMRQTVVPGRNALMLAAAWSVAAARGAEVVACGVHAGDHHIYPDCRPQFIAALQDALQLGTAGHANTRLHISTPFLYATKVEILRLGLRLGVDYGATWTCYDGQAVACGQCGACRERLEAFAEIGERDPLTYASADAA